MVKIKRKDCFGILHKMFVDGCTNNCPDFLECYHKTIRDINFPHVKNEKGGHVFLSSKVDKGVKKASKKKKRGGSK